MNIATQTEIVLRDAGYDTWTSETSLAPVVCFENAALIGFLHVFTSANALLADWESRQRSALARYAAALRSVGAKAWNVYSLFLTEDSDGSVYRQIERIEENFSLTRKIATRRHSNPARSGARFVAANRNSFSRSTGRR